MRIALQVATGLIIALALCGAMVIGLGYTFGV